MKEKMNPDSKTSSIGDEGDELWNLHDLCDQYWTEDAGPLLSEKLQRIAENGKTIEMQSCFYSFDRTSDVKWNDLFFFILESFLWHKASLLRKDICSFMEENDLKFPSFHEPFRGNGFQIVVSKGKLSIAIEDCSKAASFINGTKNISEINQDNITLLIAAAILSKPVIFIAAIIEEKQVGDYD